MRSVAARAAVLILLNLALAGCGSSSTPRGTPTVPARGKVMYQGKALTKGTVTFEPESAGREASGEIQPDGSFVLTSYKPDDGAVAGTHRVSITNAGKAVPLKYASPAASGVVVEVSEGKADYPIDLK